VRPILRLGPEGALVGPRSARLERGLRRSFSRSCIPSLGDGVMLGAAWIDRPVDTQGRAPASTSSSAPAWKRGQLTHRCAPTPSWMRT
jgi:hypothetical protein